MLFEVLISVLLFVLMVLMFAAVVSAAHRASEFGNGYAQAVSLAQKKIDQMQELGFTGVYTTSTMTATGTDQVADANPTVSGTPPALGSSITYTFTTVDKLDHYFATNGTTSKPSGTIVVTPYQTSGTVTLLQAQVTVTWPQPSGPNSSYTINTIIPKSVLF